MPRGIGELFLEGTTKINAALGGVASIVVGILVAQFLPGERIELWPVAVGGVVVLWLGSALLSALLVAVKESRRLHGFAIGVQERLEQERNDKTRPIVEAAVAPFSPYETSTCVFIVRWSAATTLPMGAQVTISTAEATHERPLGGGIVRPPQQDGKAVVTLDTPNPDAKKFVDALLDPVHHEAAVAKIRIGPGFDLQNLRPQPSTTTSLVTEPITTPSTKSEGG